MAPRFILRTGKTETGAQLMSKSQLRPDLQRVAALIPSGSKVLDLGCGNGELLTHLIAQRQCTGTGVEREPDAVLAAVGHGVPVIELDIDTQLDQFAADSYDTVVLSRTLQAVLYPVDVLRQMARIGSRLVVSMPNFGYWRHRVTLASGHMPRSKDLPFQWYDTPNLHHTTILDLEILFDRLNLTVLNRLPLDTAGHRLYPGFGANWRASSVVYLLSAQAA
jgi:methionine biosynthesis protein MetW